MSSDWGNDKPVFSVGEPFMGVLTVQMNRAMADLLNRFIYEVSQEYNPEDVETEIKAFSSALRNPHKAADIRREKRRQRQAAFDE